MSSPIERYEQVPYGTHYSFPHTHPDRLATLARLIGLEPPPLERARVLELGCGTGGNLLPMALDLPDARFVGVDLAPGQIETARADQAALGVENVEFLAGDIRALPVAGEFDVIVCHGVYSWVPADVQEAILTVCRDRLSANGLAYLSYNTFPGWSMRRTIRDMMLYHTRPFSDPAVQIQQARALLDYLVAAVRDQDDPYARSLRGELDELRAVNDAYLFHEHLELDNDPVYFHVLAERLEAAGLRYCCETAGDLQPALFPERTKPGMTLEDDDLVRLEQYRDFVFNRRFRCSLICRRERALPGLPSTLAGLHVAAPSLPERPASELDLRGPTREVFQGLNDVAISSIRPISKAALCVLSEAWPATVPFEQLVDEARARVEASAGPPVDPAELSAEALTRQLLEPFVRAAVEVRALPPRVATRPSERPLASPLARRQARHGDGIVTTQRHNAIRVNNLERHLIELSDGSRDVPELARLLTERTVREELEVTREERVVRDPDELLRIYLEAVPNVLPALYSRSLYVG